MLCSTLAYSGSDPLREITKPPEVRRTGILRLESIKVGGQFLKIDLLDALKLSMGYRYEVEPSHHKGFYSRVDKYKIKTKLSPLEFIDDFDLPLSFRIDKGAELIFIRQFKDKKKAFTKRPVFNPKKIPLTAKRARQNLIPGDFVAIPVKIDLGLFLGPGFDVGPLRGKAGVFYNVSGEFEIHIFRLANQKARVRIVSQKKKRRGFSARLKRPSKIFEIKIVDSVINQIISKDLVKYRWGETKGNMILFDYIFDLKDSSASKAYNSVLSKTFKLKTLTAASPLMNRNKVKKKIMVNLSAAEKIFQKDIKLRPQDRRVHRVFRGEDQFTERGYTFSVGRSLIKFRRKKTSTKHHITSRQEDGSRKHYYYPTYYVKNEFSAIFGLFKERYTKSVGLLFKSDKRFKTKSLNDYISTHNIRDRNFHYNEQKEHFKDIKITLPPALYNQIDWKSWNAKNRKKLKILRNAQIYYQVAISKRAFKLLGTANATSLNRGLERYLSRITPLLPTIYRKSPRGRAPSRRIPWAKFHKNEIMSFLKKLKGILLQKGNVDKKLESILSLRHNHAFKKIGIGYLLSILPKSILDSEVYFSIFAHSKELPLLDVQLPKGADLNVVFRDLLAMQNLIDDRGYEIKNPFSPGEKELGKLILAK